MIHYYFHFAEEETASERLSHLPVVTQLSQREPGFTHSQAVWLQSLCSQSLVILPLSEVGVTFDHT